MKKSIKPSTVDGQLAAPGSKSYAQRALAASLLVDGRSLLHGLTWCDDVCAAAGVCQMLGASLEVKGSTVIVSGGFAPRNTTLHCGEAGLSLRMFTPIAALHDREMTVTGKGSLLVRPVDMLAGPLTSLGATFQATNGCAPIRVKGPLLGGTAEVDGSVSSQMLTGLLLALPLAAKDTLLQVRDLKSTPYIDMTLEVMKAFGVQAKHTDYQEFRVPGGQKYQPRDYYVEGDWSGAACLLAAGAIGGSVSLTGLRRDSSQADRDILIALERCGARVAWEKDALTVAKGELRAFAFDATDCPDLFPGLAALAAHCAGTTVLKGAARLTHKESNRALVLQRELGRLGVRIEVDGDEMAIHGGPVTGGEMDACNDHRIAMAGATVAVAAGGPVSIAGPECVAKSYPKFFTDFESMLG
jgi:3-phosphoshikimate 1-carboxyvinyltransferase